MLSKYSVYRSNPLSVNSQDLLLEITLVSFMLCFQGVLIISALVYFKQQYYYKQCASNVNYLVGTVALPPV